jgi:hypothetical protein
VFCAFLSILATATLAARKAPDHLNDGPAGLVTQSQPGQSLDAFVVESANMMGLPTLDGTAENPGRRHFNAFFKSRAGWLPFSSFADATAGGTYRLYRHDAADATGLRVIKIDADAEKSSWLDIRRQFPSNPSISVGIEVRRVYRLDGRVCRCRDHPVLTR